MVNKTILTMCVLLLPVLLPACKLKAAPYNEELDMYMNDQGEACFTKIKPRKPRDLQSRG